MLLHTMLAVVVIAWTYFVATRVHYHPAWLWTGTGAVVVVGYLAIVARYVFEGVPAKVQGVIGTLSGGLVALAGIVCLLLFALVSGRAGRSWGSGATAEGARGIPTEDEGVIVPDEDVESTAGGGGSGESGRRAAPRRALLPDDAEA